MPNFVEVATAALHRIETAAGRAFLPDGLIRAHIHDGRVDYAYQLAQQLHRPERRAQMIAEVAAATDNQQLAAVRWRQAESCLANLDRWPWAQSLVSIAATGPPDRQRLLSEVETAAADFHPIGRTRLLVAVAESGPSAEMLARLEIAAASSDLDATDRARLLIAIANADPAERHRHLAAAESAVAGVDPANRLKQLVAIVRSGPSEDLLARVEVAVAGVSSRLRTEILIAIADIRPAAQARLFDAPREPPRTSTRSRRRRPSWPSSIRPRPQPTPLRPN